MKTIFRTFKKSDDVIAIFPEIAASYNYGTECLSYQSIGQHGACSACLSDDTRPSTTEEIETLTKELNLIGYDNIIPIKRFHKNHLEARKQHVLFS